MEKREQPEIIRDIIGYLASDYEYDESAVNQIFSESYDEIENSNKRLRNNLEILTKLQPDNESDFSEKVREARAEAKRLVEVSPVFQKYQDKYHFKYLLTGSLTYGFPEKWDIDLVVLSDKVDLKDSEMFSIENELRQSITSDWSEFLKKIEKHPTHDVHIDIISVDLHNLENDVNKANNLEHDNFYDVVDSLLFGFELLTAKNFVEEGISIAEKQRYMKLASESPIFRGILNLRIESYIKKIQERKSKEI